MKFKIEIDCDTPAFADDPAEEVCCILSAAVDMYQRVGLPKRAEHILKDAHGNTVGRAWVEE